MAAVGHVGDHADDALAGGALASVARYQQLHNRIVYVPVRKWEKHCIWYDVLYALKFNFSPGSANKIR